LAHAQATGGHPRRPTNLEKENKLVKTKCYNHAWGNFYG
jgi:hypothetical protein